MFIVAIQRRADALGAISPVLKNIFRVRAGISCAVALWERANSDISKARKRRFMILCFWNAEFGVGLTSGDGMESVTMQVFKIAWILLLGVKITLNGKPAVVDPGFLLFHSCGREQVDGGQPSQFS